MTYAEIESARSVRQIVLDSEKSQAERNKLGQFATPAALADDLLRYAITLFPRRPIHFLDPAIGTGSFFSALIRLARTSRIKSARGFEIDPAFARTANQLWNDAGLLVANEDFTKQRVPTKESDKATLLIANPPYVRHHHLPAVEKTRLQQLVAERTGIRMSGLSGLYCYFLLLSHAWMAQGGLAGWLIPTEFMDVNYGEQVKDYLLRQVRLVRIHRFDPNDVQFDDALVSSAVIWFRNEPSDGDAEVEFTYGGTHVAPTHRRTYSIRQLQGETKWNRLFTGDVREASEDVRVGELFTIRRGIATGANNFFILPEDQARAHGIAEQFLIPILPSPRFLEVDEINADEKGMPLIDRRLVLINCSTPEHQLSEKYPSLAQYLEQGKLQGIHETYLCQHRSPWYSQETREAPLILCTYMGRGEKDRPFRFILNHSRAIAANVYLLLYPKPVLARALATNPEIARHIWVALNSIPPSELMGEGRVYGGGLYKMEPKELANARVGAAELLSNVRATRTQQTRLF